MDSRCADYCHPLGLRRQGDINLWGFSAEGYNPYFGLEQILTSIGGNPFFSPTQLLKANGRLILNPEF